MSDRTLGELWWEDMMRLGSYRLCVCELPFVGATWGHDKPTGWAITQEDRQDGQWLAVQFGKCKTVVGSMEEAMAFAEATYNLTPK